MGAILDKNGPNGKPTVLPDGLANSEIFQCSARLCQISYTLAYGVTENRTENGQNVLDVMRKRAAKLISDDHLLHATGTYEWDPLLKMWRDREQVLVAEL